MSGPRVRVLYHYLPPDDAVSARHFGDLCDDLAKRGWQVEASASNRGCRDESLRFARHERRGKVTIRRVWRPRLPQGSTIGRLLNAAWMIVAWSFGALSGRRRPDVLLMGTDPVLSVLVALPWKLLRPRTRIVHWAFDLYPDALVADGLAPEDGVMVRLVRRLLRRAYRRCDLLVDIGPCMRQRLNRYESVARRATLVPWALVEPGQPVPSDPATRRALFGDARIGLLYSGNFGRAHTYEPILALARLLRDEPIHFCFAVRGNRAEELVRAVGPNDRNVSFAGFAAESELEKRLGAADIHLASLSADWAGVAVPSKFFGSLAAGRPVLYVGPSSSGIATWIREHRVGWVLDHDDDVPAIAETLRALARERSLLEPLQARCVSVYGKFFARAHTTEAFHHELRGLLERNQSAD